MAKSYALAPAREYIIHDRPDESSAPLRRLQREGADVLSIAELLTIALGGSISFSHLTNEYGLQFLTTLHSPEQVGEALHVDHVTAARLYAVLSLGKRLYAPNHSSMVRIRGVEDVYEHYKMLAHLPKEQLWLLLINSRYQVVHEEVLAIGSTESLHVTAKDVFQSAVERRVTAVILLHNHPSGTSEPSATDRLFTTQMRKAGEVLGIELLDHVVIAEDGYHSCMPEGPNC